MRKRQKQRDQRHPVSKEAVLDFNKFKFVHWRAKVLGRPPDDVGWAEAESTARGPREQEETGAAQMAQEDDWLCDEPQDDTGPFWSGFEEW